MGPHPDVDPYADMNDEQVLGIAAQALRRVQGYPVGSLQRAIMWARYEAAKAELDIRLYTHVVRKLKESEQ
jgi:hypothetical protein